MLQIQIRLEPVEGGGEALVAWEADRAVACLHFSVQDGLCFVPPAVDDREDGQGLARALLLGLDCYALQTRTTRLWSRIPLDDRQNVRLCQALGYTICQQEVVVSDGEPQLLVTLEKCRGGQGATTAL